MVSQISIVKILKSKSLQAEKKCIVCWIHCLTISLSVQTIHIYYPASILACIAKLNTPKGIPLDLADNAIVLTDEDKITR